MKIMVKGEERYIDGYLMNSLDIYREAVDKKWDGILFIGGYEGDGKSEFGSQLAAVIDDSYCLDRCVFTPQQFIDTVNVARPKQAIVYDEAQDAFESTNRDVMSKIVKSALTRIRRKQLFIFIIAPDFWSIKKYLFIHRSRAFIRVYADGLERGYFEFYNRERKHELYIRGKREEKLCVKPNFRGRFTHWFPLDENEYDNKKEAADVKIDIDKSVNPKKISQEAVKHYHMFLQRNNWLKHGASLELAAKVLGCSTRTLNRVVVDEVESNDFADESALERQTTRDNTTFHLLPGAADE